MSDETSSETCHLSVFFSGRVQGVGFRYQTLQIAKGFEITGFVKNLPDGRVQLEIEGSQNEADSFLAELEDQLSGYIRQTEKKRERRKQQFFDFTIQ